MKVSVRIIYLCCILFLATDVFGQKIKVIKKKYIFSAIQGTISKPDSLTVSPGAISIKFIEGEKTSFNIAPVKKNRFRITFTPAQGYIGIAKAVVQIKNKERQIVAELQLTGLSTKGLEGENEPSLATVATALGYNINTGWTTLANHSRPELLGDEIPYQLFQQAEKGSVEIIPVARYSPDFELAFGYYTDSAARPVLHQSGTLIKSNAYPQHQTLFPSSASAIRSFNPGNKSFGFYATSPTHTVYTEDVWNMLYYPGNAVRAARIYPLKDASGKIINNSFLLCYEEAKNGDYNDYVFIVKNIKPVTKNFFTQLFNGKDLTGFHSFLNNVGINTDPDQNFIVEDSMLHVIGKDLGYVITQKSYINYHLKVDFKWGERRWGSRTKEKRDAGVCYNIPVSEPDSIWPQSIECQIQEGDVGDFWMLGFSTISVNGIQNIPANHTRMIKQHDGEKPTGEWNTLEIISYNGRCVHAVNGIVVNVGEQASVKEGRILLQSEYAEIYYRNVKIREL